VEELESARVLLVTVMILVHDYQINSAQLTSTASWAACWLVMWRLTSRKSWKKVGLIWSR